MSLGAELSALAGALDELAGRLTRIGEGLTKAQSESLGPALFDVERALQSASRRLAKAVEDAV